MKRNKRLWGIIKSVSRKYWSLCLFITISFLTAGFQVNCNPTTHIDISRLQGLDNRFFKSGPFLANGEVGATINAIAEDPATGNIFVGGEFSSIDNVVANNIAVYDKAQEKWLPLNGQGLKNTDYFLSSSNVKALRIIGRFLYVGGKFDRTNDGSVLNLNSIAVYSIDFGIWINLQGLGLNGQVNALDAVGNTLYVGGAFSQSFDGTKTNLNNIATYDHLTASWSPLPGNGLNGEVHVIENEQSLILQQSIYVGGAFSRTHSGSVIDLNNIAYFDSTGGWFPLDGNGLNGPVYAINTRVQENTFVGGSFTASFDGSTTNLFNIAAYDNNWESLNGFGLNGEVRSLSSRGDDIYIGGEFSGTASGIISLHNIAGYEDGNFTWKVLSGNGLNAPVNAIVNARSEDTIFVGGEFTQTFDGSHNIRGIAGYDFGAPPAPALGTPPAVWEPFGLDSGIALDEEVKAMAADASGNIYVGGTFLTATYGPTTVNRIAKFDPTTHNWTSLANSGLNGDVEALWVAGNDLYVGGSFSATADGAVINLNRIARYNLTAGTWHSVPNNGLNGVVLSFAQKGNELWVGGRFTRTFDSAVLNLNRLARYNLMTGTWASVPNNGMNGDVNALAFKGDDLYIGGDFSRTSDNNYFLFFFTKLDTATGTYYELANSGTNLPVERLKLSGNDLYVSGQFNRTHDNTIILNQLGRYDTALNGWNAVIGYSEDMVLGRQLKASVDVGTDRYIGGEFLQIGNTVAHYFTRIYGQVWNVTATNSDWNDGANWATGAVPAANTSAVIPPGAGAVNIAVNDVVLADLIINGGTLTVGAGRTLTINGILKLGGGVIQGDGTVVITNCKRDRVMGGDAASHIRTKLVRCVDNAGVYVFPVGTAQGYAPVFVGEITGTGNVSVQPFEGEYTAPAAGLPANRLRRWWTIENPGGGVTNSQLIFNYSYPDIISNEPTYKAYRISGGTATVASDVANTYTHRTTAPNVTAFSDWTIAGDPGGPTPTPTPIPPPPTPTPTPLPIPTPTPTPPPPTPTPTPDPTPTPTPTPPPAPTLGTYSNSNVILSGNTTAIASAAPTDAATISATTDSRFRGTLVADPATGVVRVSNAHPAGLYSIKVTAFGPGGTATAAFDLSVTDGAACTQTVAFTDATDMFPAYFPTSLAIGDIDNDGDQDLAIASETYSTVSIMLGDGTGAFASAGDVGVALGPLATELADINNDGKLDLITANQGSGTISLRLGNGNGTFTSLPNIVFAAGPDGMAVGDMNNDGRRDIVVTFYSTASVRVLTGDGAGGFTVGPDMTVGNGPRDVVIADVNGDGNGDVLTANGESASVSVRLGDGMGGLSGMTEVAVGLTPVSLTLGQFDADSNLDLAVSNNQGASVSIRNGDGLGGFSGATELTAAAFPEALALGDFDNDGVHDIVVGDSATSADIVNFGDGSGGFAETLSVPAGGWPYALRIGDVNGDGRQDLVTGNWFSYQTTIRLGSCYTPTPTPTPTPEPTPTPTPQTNNITVSDNNFTVGSYNTLKEAFDSINIGTFSGAITMTVNADTTETAMATLTYSGDGPANYTSIHISPAIGGPKSITGTLPGDAIIELNGADNVTIDGINSGGTSLTLANAQSTSFGSTHTLRLLNGASNNVIRNVEILGSHPGATGTVNIGGDSLTGNGNDDNTIEFCNIGPYGGNLPHTGIRNSSTSGAANSGNVIRNNNIYDFTTNGMFIFTAKFWTISENRLFQTAPVTGSQTVMQLDDSNITTGSEGMTVTGNVIGYASAAGTGTYTVNNASLFRAMHVQLWSAGSPSTVSNNTITAISVSNASAGVQFDGIRVPQGPVTFNGNLIGSLTATDAITVSSSTTVAVESFGIYHIGVGAFTASNNQIGGLTFDNANTGALIFRGIAAVNVRIGPFTAIGNTIGGSLADSIRTRGFNSFGTPSQVIGISAGGWPSTITGNTIQNLTSRDGIGTAAQASVIGIVTTDASVNHSIGVNTIRDLTNSGAFGGLSSAVTGIQFTGSTANAVERNHISRLFNAATGTSSEASGIRIAGGTTVFRNNMVAIGDNILNAIGTGSTTGGVNGINETAGTNTFHHNSVSITGLPTAGAGPSFALNSAVVTNARSYRNNIFYNGRSNNGSTGKNYAVRVGGTGTNPTGLTINNNLYYSTGTGAIFGYYASTDRAGLSAWQTATGQDAASIVGDPLFTSALLGSTPDLHLGPTSPARDAAINLGVVNDFDGQLRPIGGGIDIGADEVLDPSAATVTVSGRLTTASGIGIRNGILTLSDSTGHIRMVQTGSFGYYRFDEVAVGQAYVLSAAGKRYQFIDPTRLILIGEDAMEIDFVAMP